MIFPGVQFLNKNLFEKCMPLWKPMHKVWNFFLALDQILIEAFINGFKNKIKFFKGGRDWAVGQGEGRCV